MTHTQDVLTDLSAALAARAEGVRPLIAEIHTDDSSSRSGTLWRPDIVIASEQSLPDAESFDIVLAGGASKARLAGRDGGTNVAVLKLEQPAKSALPAISHGKVGALALAYGADGNGGITARLGSVALDGGEWHSRAGGKIDARIHLDMQIGTSEEGGPVLDANGELLGISTLGPRGRVLVIPASTIERVIGPLLANGRIERGWLGLALQPVAVPDSLRAAAAQDSGLMVMSAADDGPASKAGVVAGDILLQIAGVSVVRMRRLAEQLGPDSVGKQLELKLIRAGALISLTATITPRPKDG
ncbi:MAG: PDZ domain-containing protein [Rhizomicrobium sp.]